MDFEEFLQSTLGEDKTKTPQKKAKNQRSAKEIMAELMPFVEADRKKMIGG